MLGRADICTDDSDAGTVESVIFHLGYRVVVEGCLSILQPAIMAYAVNST